MVDPEPPLLAAPALENLLGHAGPAGDLSHCAALGYRPLRLSHLVDHLLRGMSLLGHLPPFNGPKLTLYLDRTWGQVIPNCEFRYAGTNFALATRSVTATEGKLIQSWHENDAQMTY